MSRATVRAAVADYLQGAGISLLGSVFQHPMKVTPEGEFVLNETPGTATGAVIYVHLEDQFERRLGAGAPLGSGAAGLKLRQYKVNLICVLRSDKPDAQDVGDDNDTFLDSLVAAIETSRTAGSPSTVFQWGEGDTFGAPDIDIHAGMARVLRLQMSQVYSTVEVMVLEQINS